MRLWSSGLVVVAVAIGVGGTAGAADANNLNYLYQQDSSAPYYGVRATIDNPSSSEASISNGDFFVTSVAATDCGGGSCGNAIQQGVTYEWNMSEDSCNLGSQGNGAVLYYFTETETGGSYTCYNGGSATFSSSHKQTVDYNSGSGLWTAYMDGNSTGITNSWPPCNGRACEIRAFAEEASSKTGTWHAKFAGSGNTPWQYYNGSGWYTIYSYSTHAASYWSSLSGPFPSGIWSFTYSN